MLGEYNFLITGGTRDRRVELADQILAYCWDLVEHKSDIEVTGAPKCSGEICLFVVTLDNTRISIQTGDSANLDFNVTDQFTGIIDCGESTDQADFPNLLIRVTTHSNTKVILELITERCAFLNHLQIDKPKANSLYTPRRIGALLTAVGITSLIALVRQFNFGTPSSSFSEEILGYIAIFTATIIPGIGILQLFSGKSIFEIEVWFSQQSKSKKILLSFSAGVIALSVSLLAGRLLR